jgi:hypothetical protein
MGEDIRLEIDTQTQMKEVFQLIAARKSIPKSRFVIKIPAFLEAAPASNPAPELADNECVFLFFFFVHMLLIVCLWSLEVAMLGTLSVA